MMVRFKKFMLEKSNWIHIIAICMAVIATCISFFCERFSYQVISCMFLFIAGESFILKITYMDDIRNDLDNLTSQKKMGIMLKKSEDCNNPTAIINQATKDVFVNYGSLMGWQELARTIKSRTDLKIRLLVLNLEDKEILKSYKEMIGDGEKTGDSIRFLEQYSGFPHIEVKIIDSIMPVFFIAVDIDTNNGYIRANHILNDGNGNLGCDNPMMELTLANGDWYNVYRKQIDTIWKRGREFK